MTNSENADSQFSAISSTISQLTRILTILQSIVGLPQIVEKSDTGGEGSFRYPSPDARTIQLLLFVRIISGCNSVVRLLRAGYVVEARVIMRTIDDFLGDLLFVEDALQSKSGWNIHQKNFIDSYFLEADDPSKERVTRKQKVQAAEARRLNPENTFEAILISKNIDNSFDSAVHGEYGPVMDLYVSNQNGTKGKFEVSGVNSEDLTAGYRLILASFVHRACASAIMISNSIKSREMYLCANEVWKYIEEFVELDD